MRRGFDVIVVGAGHAGCEAAYAAARVGAHVGLCTLGTDTVAHMPCNPAIGGTAKGHLVREVDALGGLMGRAIDATGIQFKLLNRSRGPAVWSPRAQADKRIYGAWMKSALEREPNIEWLIGRAGRVLTSDGECIGLAMEDGGIRPEQVGYINAHGTSTPHGDGAETAAVKTVFGAQAKKLIFGSTKSMTGHLLGAAGALEFAVCTLVLRNGVIPPTINQFTPDPACDLDSAPNHSVKREVEVALSNSFGFGGHNVTLAVRRV